MPVVPEILEILEPRPMLAVLAVSAAALATVAAAVVLRIRGRVPGRAVLVILVADAVAALGGGYAGFRFRVAVEGTGSPILDPPATLAASAVSVAVARAPELSGGFIQRHITLGFVDGDEGNPGIRPRIRVAYTGLAGGNGFTAARGSAIRLVSQLDAIVRIAWLGAAESEADALRALRWENPRAPEDLSPRIREVLAGIRARFPAETVREAADALARALRIEG
ncbi:MAG: hypothetical protein JXP34_10780 [Planctomycetes bacterium]|nr:hypothetical protein [Planctomycetota bacterium]